MGGLGRWRVTLGLVCSGGLQTRPAVPRRCAVLERFGCPLLQFARHGEVMDLLPEAIDLCAEVSQPTDAIVRPRTLLSAGISRGIFERLVAIRHLRRVLHGLYLVGSARLTQRQLHRVNLMRAGAAGALTAQSGLEVKAVLWPREGLSTGLTANSNAVGEHFTMVPMDSGDPGLIRLRHVDERVPTEEVAGFAVAPMGRMLTDLVAFDGGHLLNIAWNQAEFRGLLDQDALRSDIGSGNRTGAAEVGKLVDHRRIVTKPGDDLRGKTELPWLHLMLEAGIPMPALNAPVVAGRSSYFADYLWIKYMVALELDSPDHLTPVVAARDRARDDDFDSVGIHVLRLIDSVALADPRPHLERIKGALRRRGWTGA